jgi:hypothetical protein
MELVVLPILCQLASQFFHSVVTNIYFANIKPS